MSHLLRHLYCTVTALTNSAVSRGRLTPVGVPSFCCEPFNKEIWVGQGEQLLQQILSLLLCGPCIHTGMVWHYLLLHIIPFCRVSKYSVYS